MPIWNLLCSFCGFNCVLEHADFIYSTWNIVFTFSNLQKYLSSPSDFNSAVPLWLHSVSCLFRFLLVIQGFCFWVCYYFHLSLSVNLLTPNDHYSGRTAQLTSKRCNLYIYSTNRGTEYFKHGIYSPFFSLQNAVCFIILTYLVPVLFTFYIQGVLKFKKIIPAPKG